jgi:hypothetical protein
MCETVGEVQIDGSLALDQLVESPRGNTDIGRQVEYADVAGSEEFL